MSEWKNHLRVVPDFPSKGIYFQDLSPIFSQKKLFSSLIEELLELFMIDEIDAFAGIESRGFILASALATKAQKGLVLLRKKGKLPPPVFQESYQLEYGEATLEIQPGKGKMILIDDVLATGGTVSAGIKLCEQAGYQICDVGFVLNISSLNKFRFNDRSPKALIHL